MFNQLVILLDEGARLRKPIFYILSRRFEAGIALVDREFENDCVPEVWTFGGHLYKKRIASQSLKSAAKR